MQYAKVNRDLTDTGERARLDSPPPSYTELAPGKPFWVPVVRIDPKPPGKMRDSEIVDITNTQMTVTLTYRDKTAEELANDAEQAKWAADVAEARADATIQALKALSPSQVVSYIDSNVTDLLSAKTVLKQFGKALCILARGI